MAAVSNITQCINTNIPVVSGTTGWLEAYDDMVALCKEKQEAFLYGSNFSLGVNLFFELNDYLAKLMSRFDEYTIQLEEIHHTQKKDAPSGTALSLANQILPFYPNKKSIVNTKTSDNNVLSIESLREDPAPGTHHIMYESIEDSIQITHTAHNRKDRKSVV